MRVAVSFQDVTKRYLRPRVRSSALVTEALLALGGRVGLSRPETAATGRIREVHALDRVSFEVFEGESFGLIGPNGAGKSTALKLLTRVSPLTEGRIEVRGRIGALLEVGSGIHPELTGRENIWLYGRILGMRSAVIRKRFDDIVGFAELGHVLDMPVKRYSTGMQLRLGFSIAAHIDPDIFVVDEALSVGDAAFQAKCVQRMMEFTKEGKTLVFVSHNLATMEALCQRAAFIDAGRLVEQGPVHDVLERYLRSVEEGRSQAVKAGEAESPNGSLTLLGASCHDEDGNVRYAFGPRDYLEIRLRFDSSRLESPNVAIGITDGRPGYLVFCSMAEDGQAPPAVGPGPWEVVLRIGELRLRPRLYEVFCIVTEADSLTWRSALTATTFRVESPELGKGNLALMSSRVAGALDVDYEWDVREGQLDGVADGGLSVPGLTPA